MMEKIRPSEHSRKPPVEGLAAPNYSLTSSVALAPGLIPRLGSAPGACLAPVPKCAGGTGPGHVLPACLASVGRNAVSC
jgi:hypothetical protein